MFVKGYGILSFPEDMSKNIGKNISQNLSGRYRQKRFDHSKQRTTDVLKTVSEKGNQKNIRNDWPFQ